MTDEKQPLPTADRESVTEALIADLRQRQAKGIETYGRSLETFNGRDAVQDALEEALDLAQYLKQWQLERAALLAENARLQEGIDHYRAKRRVDGSSDRPWDAVEHWKAEQAVCEWEGEPIP